MITEKDCSILKDLIFDKINRLSLIPNIENAVIAGGSVCNLLHNHFNKENSPINDIDIFVFQEKESNKDLNIDGAYLNYNFTISTKKNEKYKILSTKRDGLINYIYVEIEHKENIIELTKTLLNNFDINATKGALILKNKELVVLNDFIEFLNTKQIKATSIETPIKTILRLLKKKKELNCYLSQSHIQSIYQFSRFKDTVIIEENFKKFKLEIEEFGYLFPIKLKNGNVKLKYLKEFDPFHKNEIELIKKHNGSILIPILELKYSKSKKYLKYEKIRPYWKTLKNVLFNDFEFKTKKDFNEKNLVYLEKILNTVPELTFSFSNKSLQELLDLSLKIESYRLTDDFFKQFLGFLSKKDIVLSKIENEFKSFKKEYLRKSIPIVEPLIHKIKFIRELISKNDLELEGVEMNHCVGGYFNKISSNNRIFSIKKGKFRSTLEISKVNNQWIGVQHFGKNNSFPHQELRDIAISFILILN